MHKLRNIFRYQDLGQANEHKDMAVLPTWSICIGEYALDINVQQTAKLINNIRLVRAYVCT